MITLGIESSCDETAVAILKDGDHVLSSKIASQDAHARFGGVIPEIAAREHLRCIHVLLQEALVEAQISLADVDIIGVTQGPGLIGALLVGVSFAKGLAHSLAKPLVPVNHVHAHIHGALLGLSATQKTSPLFPSLALVVSGGHTHLYSMSDAVTFNLEASSVDDACGESFDKVAKLLGIPYPGGPVIERLAREGDAKKIAMPKMMEKKDRLAFSYSGLKTHIRYLIEKEPQPISLSRQQDICAAFQSEALEQIARKLEHLLSLKKGTRSVLVSGGVAANQYFRNLMAEKIKVPCYFPSLKYCADNAAMIAALAWHLYKSSSDQTQFRDLNWEAFSRYEEAPHSMSSN